MEAKRRPSKSTVAALLLVSVTLLLIMALDRSSCPLLWRADLNDDLLLPSIFTKGVARLWQGRWRCEVGAGNRGYSIWVDGLRR